MQSNKNRVLILMGSESDSSLMQSSLPYFQYFGIEPDFVVSSAHRNPERTAELASTAKERGYCAIVCGAGMAAHLAGICAAHSDLPVLGVPLAGGIADGLDALLSTVQMPSGVPVATFAVGKAGVVNSVVFIARILSLHDLAIKARLDEFRANDCKLTAVK